MEKMKFETPDLVSGNIEKIGALFPSVITEMQDEEGNLKKGIDFDALKQLLSRDVVADGGERYEFTWVGKNAAKAEAARPTTNTLRPVKEESKDWETTENLYIEGDNLEVLKILQESYLGKVKMIYIDPPYNTGHDFVYPDSFAMDDEDYSGGTGYFDEDGNVNFKRENSASAGKYHSDWCSMMYSRLALARNLLTDDGVIFISIGEDEIANLHKLCNELFNESNYIATIPWRKRTAKSDVPFGVSQDYEWVLCYAKTEKYMACVEGTPRKYFETPDFPGRPWRVHDLTTQRTAAERPNSYFTMVNPKTGKEYPANPLRTWAVSKETFKKYYDEGKIVFPDDYEFLSITKPAFRYWKEDDETKAGQMFGMMPVSTKLPESVGMSLDGTKEITDLFAGKVFSYPKPTSLISFLTDISTKIDKEAVVLDFFSGSAATAQAVMQLNSEDGGRRKFIMVQLPEPCDEKSEAFKAGYKNICEIGKERIRRAANEIAEKRQNSIDLDKHEWDQLTYYVEHQEECDKLGHLPDSYFDENYPELDLGFRVFRVDSTNMKDVYYHPDDLTQTSLQDMISNIKDDRTDMDLLYACLLDWGVEINLPHTSVEVEGCTVHNVDHGALMACFNANVPASVIAYMAKQQPLRAVFRDNAFAADDAKINVTETFKNFSPDTRVKVI